MLMCSNIDIVAHKLTLKHCNLFLFLLIKNNKMKKLKESMFELMLNLVFSIYMSLNLYS